MRTQVLLDTNFILLVGQHINIFHEIAELLNEPHELIVVDPVMKELKKLALGTSKTASAAKLSLLLVETKALESPKGVEKLLWKPSQPLKTVRSSEKHADDAILALASGKAIICTLDKPLQKRYAGRIITVKGKKLQLREV